jgi:hypothetical protein
MGQSQMGLENIHHSADIGNHKRTVHLSAHIKETLQFPNTTTLSDSSAPQLLTSKPLFSS